MKLALQPTLRIHDTVIELIKAGADVRASISAHSSPQAQMLFAAFSNEFQHNVGNDSSFPVLLGEPKSGEGKPRLFLCDFGEYPQRGDVDFTDFKGIEKTDSPLVRTALNYAHGIAPMGMTLVYNVEATPDQLKKAATFDIALPMTDRHETLGRREDGAITMVPSGEADFQADDEVIVTLDPTYHAAAMLRYEAGGTVNVWDAEEQVEYTTNNADGGNAPKMMLTANSGNAGNTLLLKDAESLELSNRIYRGEATRGRFEVFTSCFPLTQLSAQLLAGIDTPFGIYILEPFNDKPTASLHMARVEIDDQGGVMLAVLDDDDHDKAMAAIYDINHDVQNNACVVLPDEGVPAQTLKDYGYASVDLFSLCLSAKP